MTRQFKVTVNGREYDVAVQEVTPDALADSGFIVGGSPATHMPTPSVVTPGIPAATSVASSAAAHAAESGDVTAQMGGVIVHIEVQVGQSVNVGDRLLVLEAMKMKSPLLSSRAGKVSRILVTTGDAVEGGQLLLTIN